MHFIITMLKSTHSMQETMKYDINSIFMFGQSPQSLNDLLQCDVHDQMCMLPNIYSGVACIEDTIIPDSLITFVTITAPYSPAGLQV